MISRAVNLFTEYKQRLIEYGFRYVVITNVERDGLYSLIEEMKPRIIFVDSNFKKGDTPFWITELRKRFPNNYIAVISLAEYPDDLAMYCIVNGAKSYVTIMDGMDEFTKGMKEIVRGEEYVSPSVRERHLMRSDTNMTRTGHITDGQLRLIKIAANGFTNAEIAKTFEISETSVETRKSETYAAMNVRNAVELTVKALRMNLTSLDEIVFYGGDYELKPLPKKKKKQKQKEIA